MPKTVDELIALIADGDTEAAEELKTVLAAEKRDKTAAQRDLKLKTDGKLKERFPRALAAYEKGRFKPGDDLSEDDLLAALADKEDELADLGVPLPGTPAEPTPTAAVQGDDDPTKALSGGKGASSPGGQQPDLVTEAINLLKNGTTVHDQAKAFKMLAELNQSGQTEKVAEITRALEARPIMPPI